MSEKSAMFPGDFSAGRTAINVTRCALHSKVARRKRGVRLEPLPSCALRRLVTPKGSLRTQFSLVVDKLGVL